jgi:hypothetical protein
MHSNPYWVSSPFEQLYIPFLPYIRQLRQYHRQKTKSAGYLHYWYSKSSFRMQSPIDSISSISSSPIFEKSIFSLTSVGSPLYSHLTFGSASSYPKGPIPISSRFFFAFSMSLAIMTIYSKLVNIDFSAINHTPYKSQIFLCRALLTPVGSEKRNFLASYYHN